MRVPDRYLKSEFLVEPPPPALFASCETRSARYQCTSMRNPDPLDICLPDDAHQRAIFIKQTSLFTDNGPVPHTIARSDVHQSRRRQRWEGSLRQYDLQPVSVSRPQPTFADGSKRMLLGALSGTRCHTALPDTVCDAAVLFESVQPTDAPVPGCTGACDAALSRNRRA